MCRGAENPGVPLHILERGRVVPTKELQRPAAEDRPGDRPVRAIQQGQPAPQDNDHRGGPMNRRRSLLIAWICYKIMRRVPDGQKTITFNLDNVPDQGDLDDQYQAGEDLP